MTNSYPLSTRFKSLGTRHVPVWYPTSREIIDEFEIVGKQLKLLGNIPHLPPLYDWIMGFYERPSNRHALDGPAIENAATIVDVGVGTGYLLSRLLSLTHEKQAISAVDLSSKMIENAKNYLQKKRQLSDRICFHQADCQKMPWDDNSFDLYVSSYLFDLLPEAELRKAIAEMERILKPDGYAILVTMTTELNTVPWMKKIFYQMMNEFYFLGYDKGRWNRIWKVLFNGYAPHCRPIALGSYLKESEKMMIVYSKLSRVSLFPVRIYYARKTHE